MIYEILNTLLFLIGTSTGVAIIQTQSWYDELLNLIKLNRKPINCSLCLTFWLSIIFLTIKGIPIVITICCAFINAYVAEMLYRKLMNMI